MFDKYLICTDGLRNVISETGHVEGFEMKIRIPYYRGVPLSVIEEIKIAVGGGVDGGAQIFGNDQIRFSVASGSFMMSEMSTVATKRWNFDEDATIKVYRPGGLVYFDRSSTSRPPWTGSANTAASITPSTSGVGGTSGRGRWETWAATISTPSFGR